LTTFEPQEEKLFFTRFKVQVCGYENGVGEMLSCIRYASEHAQYYPLTIAIVPQVAVS